MKYQHNRNISLNNEKHRNQPSIHQRSFSYNRGQKTYGNPHLNYLLPDNFINDSITLPISTELTREIKNKHKKSEKEVLKSIGKEKKKRRSKDLESNSRKKRPEKVEQKAKKSGEKNQKSSMGHNSKELLRQKYSHQKAKESNSSEAKHKKPTEPKKNTIEKNGKSFQNGQKQRKNKKQSKQDNVGVEWEEIIKRFGNLLTISQIAQVKEYKWIYFLGKIKERRPPPILQEGQPLNTARYHNKFEKQIEQSQTEQRQRCISSPRSNPCGDQKYFMQYFSPFYKYEIGDHIAYRYEILESINQGSFGEVIKVYDHKTREYLALKICKRNQQFVQQTFMEISILTQIRQRDKSNLSGVVRIKDFTIFRNHICMIFQLLDGNLYELLVANRYNGLSQDVVRIFAVQILNSLSFLQKEKVIHCDIKPENIVMKTWGKSGIKLVDFGTSCFEGRQIYQYLQSRYYRAPEVIFKQKYSYPIDMWSFGCLIAELKLGEPIFAGSTNLEQVMYITNSIGFPNQEDGPLSERFLQSEQFQVLLEEDYLGCYGQILQKGLDPKKNPYFCDFKYIKTCMKSLKERLLECRDIDREDMGLYDFLLKILVWEPEKRLTPNQALQQPWIAKGLPNEIKQLYTIFNNIEYSKKGQNKQSKDSKYSGAGKSNSKKSSKQKVKMKEHSNDKKKQNRYRQFKAKQSSTIAETKFYSYNSKICNSNPSNL